MAAVITGGNKGIGFEVAKQLLAMPSSRRGFNELIIACRNPKLGVEAAERLGCRYLPLDLNDEKSIEAFAVRLERDYGSLECLVNNAGIFYTNADPTPLNEVCEAVLRVNFFNTVLLTERLLPLLAKAKTPRIVNVASGLGRLKQVPPKRQTEFSADTVTLPAVKELMQEFRSDVLAKRHHEKDWSNCDYSFVYSMSKLGLIAATRIFARENPMFRINACCPGYCKTDMTKHQGHRAPEDGARNAVFCVLVEPDGFTGEMIEDEAISTW